MKYYRNTLYFKINRYLYIFIKKKKIINKIIIIRISNYGHKPVDTFIRF